MRHEAINYFSVFSGIGGFELGISRAMAAVDGRRCDRPRNFASPRTPACIGYCEIDKYAHQIYRRHFPTQTNYGDITKIGESSLPDFDLLVGGFPCQAFSIAGKRRGFEDIRGTLFFDIARIIGTKKPRQFILENVKGLLSHDDGRTFKTIVATLVELGYGVEWQVLNSKDFAVPQNRERVFIVGHLGGRCARQIFPLGGDDRVSYGAKVPGRRQAQTAVSHALRSPKVAAEQTFILHELTPPGTSDAQRIYDAGGIGRTLKGESGGQAGKMGLYRIGGRVRRLTPTECERIQGFPDGWTRFGSDGEISDTQRYKTLGNAVTVNVVAAIVAELVRRQ